MKTKSWAIAVTSKNENIADLTFTIPSLVKANVWGEWSKNFSLARCGPYMGVLTRFFFSFNGYIFDLIRQQ